MLTNQSHVVLIGCVFWLVFKNLFICIRNISSIFRINSLHRAIYMFLSVVWFLHLVTKISLEWFDTTACHHVIHFTSVFYILLLLLVFTTPVIVNLTGHYFWFRKFFVLVFIGFKAKYLNVKFTVSCIYLCNIIFFLLIFFIASLMFQYINFIPKIVWWPNWLPL